MPVRPAAPLLCVAVILGGCAEPAVTRIVDGRPQAGRYISETAYGLFARGAVAEVSGNPGGALRAFELAASEDPQSPEIWTHLGALHCRAPRDEAPGGSAPPPAAMAAFARAEAADPTFGPLYRERARCLAASGRAPEARADAERALALDPDDLDTAIVRAEVLSAAGEREQAVLSLRAAAARRPASSAPWRALLDLARRTEDAPLGREAAQRLAGLAPLAAQPDLVLPALDPLAAVDAALRVGDLAEAQRRALKLRVGSAEVALRAVALGRPALAREQAELVLGADPADASARIALAAAADLRGDVGALEAALHGIPARSTAPSALARWLFAEVLRRRVGADAALAWLGAAPGGGREQQDALLVETEKRVRAALAVP